MVCPRCKERGLRSQVFLHPGTKASTWWDENGMQHDHREKLSYTCTKAHSWTEKSKDPCWCLGLVITHTETGEHHHV